MWKGDMQLKPEIVMVVNSAMDPLGDEAASAAAGGAPREPPPPYSEQPQPYQHVVRETIILQPPLKSRPILFPCPMCRKRVMTRVEHVSTRKTHLIAGFICGFTIWCCSCCLAAVPYFIPTFKRAEHYCSECNKFLGGYSR